MKSPTLTRLSMALTVFGLVVGAASLSAQTELDTAEAEAFLGTWSITLESPDGEFPLVVDLSDADGKLAMEIGDGQQGQEVTDVTKSGEELVGSYLMFVQGMDVPVTVRLGMDGENLQSSWDFADGAFLVDAVGTKQQ